MPSADKVGSPRRHLVARLETGAAGEMMGIIGAFVSGEDPLIGAGLAKLLESDPVVDVLPDERAHEAAVVVLATGSVSPATVSMLRAAASNNGAPVVLVVKELSESELIIAIELNVVAVVPWAQATGETLSSAVRVAANAGAVMPTKLQAHLVKELRQRLESTSHHASALTEREIDVLRLVADGFDTADIAVKLRYSERTVKNILYGVTKRLRLRNRVHAVAYALRAGMI